MKGRLGSVCFRQHIFQSWEREAKTVFKPTLPEADGRGQRRERTEV